MKSIFSLSDVYREKTISRFWLKVDSSRGPYECWPWTGAKDRYGKIAIWDGKKRSCMLAHRIAYELHYGAIPFGLLVCHHCDNPSCCNPKHLFVGTNKDNSDDCSYKNRCATNISIDTIRAILDECAYGDITKKEIAMKYHVSYSSIFRFIKGQRRKYITQPFCVINDKTANTCNCPGI